MRSKILFIGVALFFAQYSWAAGKCSTVDSKRICEIQVGSATEWNAIDDDLKSCVVECGSVDSAKIVLTADISFGDKAPDNLCQANVNPIKRFTSFSVTSEGTSTYTLSNGCLKNESESIFALFVNANASFTLSNVNFENFYVDAANAERSAFLLGTSKSMVNVENASFKNIALTSGASNRYTGMLLASCGSQAGMVGVTYTNIKGENLSVVTENVEYAGGLVGFSESPVSLVKSNIGITLNRNRADEIADNTRSMVGGFVGGTISKVFVQDDTLDVNVSVVDVHDASSMVGGLVGFGAQSMLELGVTNSVVTGSVNVYSKKNDASNVRDQVSVGGLVGCWSVHSDISNINVLDDSVDVDVTLSGAAANRAYVGGVVGLLDVLGSSRVTANFKNVSYNGGVNAVDAQLDKVYAAGVLGGAVGSTKNVNLHLDTVRVNALVSMDGEMSTIEMGGFIGLAERLDTLKIERSYAWGAEDYLLYAKTSGGKEVSYYAGGAVGFLNKAQSSVIEKSFARGEIAVFGGKNSVSAQGKVLAGIVGFVENENSRTQIQDVYYIGAYGVTGNAKSGNFLGVAYTSDKSVDLNAAYSVEQNGLATASSNVDANGVVVTVDSDFAAVATQDFTDRLNEFDDGWVWSDTLNGGLPQLKFFAGIDGGKFDPKNDPDEPEDPTPENPVDSVPLYVQVWTSGNMAKMSVEFYDVEEGNGFGPVYARLLNASGKAVVEKLLAESLESQKYTEVFGQLDADEYSVEICADSASGAHCSKVFAKTDSWRVQKYVNREGSGYWQMVALSAIDSDFSKFGDDNFYRWDESDAIGEYWQYKVFDGFDDVEEGEGGWFYAASGINLPAKKYELKTESDSLVWNLKNMHSGWNMVANPYPWNIRVESTGDFDDAENGAEPLWFWNDATESYEAVDTLPAFSAFWLHTDQDNAVRSACAAPVFGGRADIEFGSNRKVPPGSPVSAISAGALAKKSSASSWSLRLVLKGDDGSMDRWNVVGVGSRDVSIEEPPAGMGKGVKLSIAENGSGLIRGKALAKSVVTAFAGNASENLEYSWTVAISSGNDGVAKFSVEGLDKLESAGLKAVLELDGKTYGLKAGASVDVDVSSEVCYARVKVVPAGTRLALAGPAISALGFTNFGTSLNVSFAADETLDGSKAEVRLMTLNGRTIALARGSVRSGVNSLNVAAPAHGGVYMLHVRAAGESRSVRIRL